MVRPQRQTPKPPRVIEWDALTATGGAYSSIRHPIRRAILTTEKVNDCPETSASSPGLGLAGLYCLRDTGHPGRHIALGLGGVMAAWPGDHEPTLDDLTD